MRMGFPYQDWLSLSGWAFPFRMGFHNQDGFSLSGLAFPIRIGFPYQDGLFLSGWALIMCSSLFWSLNEMCTKCDNYSRKIEESLMLFSSNTELHNMGNVGNVKNLILLTCNYEPHNVVNVKVLIRYTTLRFTDASITLPTMR